MPQQADVAVIAYFKKPEQNSPDIIIKDNPAGNVNTVNRFYQCNAKFKIEKNICYGIYLLNETANRGAINFQTLTEGGNRLTVLDDVGDFFEDAWDAIGNALEGLAGFVVSAASGIVLQVGGMVINFVTTGELPKHRFLTDAEYNWANDKIFNGTLPSKKSIILTNLLSVGEREFTIPNGFGQIYLNMGRGYDNPLTHMRLPSSYTQEGQIFIHELTHAWQIEHNTHLKSVGEGFANQINALVEGQKAVYTPDLNKPWKDNNFEQQATITDRCFQYINKFDKKGNPTPVRCTKEELLVVQNVRNNLPFPFDKPSVKESNTPTVGTRNISGRIRWSDFNITPTGNGPANEMFAETIEIPEKKYETQIYNCTNTVKTTFSATNKIIKPRIVFNGPSSVILPTTIVTAHLK